MTSHRAPTRDLGQRGIGWRSGLVPIAWLACVTAGPGCADQYPVSKVPTRHLASGGNAAAWEYEVNVRADGAELEVAATLARGAAVELSVSERAEPFVRDLRVERGGSWETVEPRGTSWFVQECASGCRIRYRFDLRQAAQQVGRDSIAKRLAEGVFESPPHAWLVHPLLVRKDDRIRFHVATAGGVQFATGLAEGSSPKTYEFSAVEIERVPYTLFGKWRSSVIQVGGARLELAILPGRFRASDADLERWISRSAGIVYDYYGSFPVDGALYTIVPSSGDSVGFGRALAGAGGASILLDVGRETEESAFLADWVAIHETIHLTFPSVAREHIWVEEGLATYVEPIVRKRAGLISEKDVWHEFYEMMPYGLPGKADQGMDRTHTWGRVYWGGALFWLVADVEIRKRTQNAHSVGDALRAILRAGGNNTESWDLARAWGQGDRATGTHVLQELGTSMGSQPGSIDLKGLFRELGVTMQGGQVVLEDAAPLAAIRKAITEGNDGPARRSRT